MDSRYLVTESQTNSGQKGPPEVTLFYSLLKVNLTRSSGRGISPIQSKNSENSIGYPCFYYAACH